MLRSSKPDIATFRADYANRADFCEVFEKEMKPLYLLAFLLTANHQQAEQCFASTVEEALKKQAVFKEWARSWVKRTLIEKAIEIVSPVLDQPEEKRDLWSAGHNETPGQDRIDPVTKLAPLERFVFVISILERYSRSDCALLLGCSMNKVAEARTIALRRLPDSIGALPLLRQRLPLYRLEVSA
jgi:DNA-directed RNA polymerase specialized sigma24 family protein